ncbi:hypothetical protein U1Q18_034428 [Sarracenia purpurea var. burkii]
MTTLSLLLLSVILILCNFSQADLIDDTCKKIDYPDLCSSTLRSDPRSNTTDVKVFARIVLKVTLVKANSTLNKVNNLLKTTTERVLKECLTICSGQYTSAVYEIPQCIDDFGSNKLNAQICVDGILDETTTCEETFSEPPKRKSPLTTSNNAVEQLAIIASGIIDSFP